MCGSAGTDRAVDGRGEWGGPGTDILYEFHVAQGDRVDFEVVCPHWLIGFNGLILKRNVFDSCVESCQYFHMHNIYRWNLHFIVFLKIQ